MKNITYLFVVCISLFCLPAFAQDNVDNNKPVASAAVPVAAPISSPPITWPEVADKSVSQTLDFLKQNTVALANVVKDVAPEVWRILILQQYVRGLQNILPAILFFIATLISWKIAYKIAAPFSDDDYRYKSEDPQFITNAVCAIISAIAFVLIILATTSSIGYFINPEFYALKDLFALIRGREI